MHGGGGGGGGGGGSPRDSDLGAYHCQETVIIIVIFASSPSIFLVTLPGETLR